MYTRALTIWIGVGFLPTILLFSLFLRFLRRRDNASWADVEDTAVLVRWLAPAVAVMAVLPLLQLHRHSGMLVAVACLGSMGVSETMAFALIMWRWRLRAVREIYSFRSLLDLYVRSMSRVIGMGAYLCGAALAGGSAFTLRPDARLYMSLILSSWIGLYIFNRARNAQDYMPGKWHLLAPCELFRRTREIANHLGGKVNSVYMISSDFRQANACACSLDSIALREDLLGNLTKPEVDTVIAHEVAHTLDVGYWGLYYPVLILAWLAWFALVLTVGRFVTCSRSLAYLLWPAIFLLPCLAGRAYRRSMERAAERKADLLPSPQAAVSCDEKLALANDHPADRPWWSRMLSTHPSREEAIFAHAQRTGLTKEEVARIREVARAEFDQGGGEQYEPELHLASSPELLGQPKDQPIWLLYLIVVFLGVIFLGASFGLLPTATGPAAVLLVFGIMAGAVAFIVGLAFVADWFTARLWRKYQAGLRQKLSSMFSVDSDDMTLVSVNSIRDWPCHNSHGAFLDVTADKVVVLSEGGEQTVDVGSVTKVVSYKGRLFDPGRVVVWYEHQGVPQWLVARPLRHTEKKLPRTSRELECWLRKRLTDSGVTLGSQPQERSGLVARRVPAALFIAAAAAVLGWFVSSRTALADFAGLVATVVAVVEAQYLSRWLHLPADRSAP